LLIQKLSNMGGGRGKKKDRPLGPKKKKIIWEKTIRSKQEAKRFPSVLGGKKGGSHKQKKREKSDRSLTKKGKKTAPEEKSDEYYRLKRKRRLQKKEPKASGQEGVRLSWEGAARGKGLGNRGRQAQGKNGPLRGEKKRNRLRKAGKKPGAGGGECSREKKGGEENVPLGEKRGSLATEKMGYLK